MLSVQELQTRIERCLEDLSEQAERLRAALDALAPAADALAPAADALAPAADALAPVDPAPARSNTDTTGTTGGAAKSQAEESTAPATGAERALHDLRSELSAGLRNGRS